MPTVTVLSERVAVDKIEHVAVTLLPAAFAATALQLTPEPDIVTAFAPPRFVPVMVIETFAEPDVGRAEDVGEIDEILTKFVVSVAVLVTAPAATVTLFDVELALASRIASGASGERLPRSVYVALPPAANVIVPERVVLLVLPEATQVDPVVAEQAQPPVPVLIADAPCGV